MAVRRRRKNPLVADIIKGSAITPVINKVKDHVLGYYSKKGKKGRKKNPELIMSSHHDHTMIPAHDVANLVGGEFIPLKGMIINNDEIQLITEPGVRLANSTKTRLKKLVNPTKRRNNPSRKGSIVNMAANEVYKAGKQAAKSGLSFNKAFDLYWTSTTEVIKNSIPKARAKRAFDLGYYET
jgi:hypothetical protein